MSNNEDKSGEKIILQGGGDHATVVADCLMQQGRKLIAIFDPKMSGDLFSVPRRGPYDPAFQKDAKAIVTIGDNRVRKKVVAETEHDFTKAIHSSAIVSPAVSVGKGSMILHGAIIQANAKIGEHVIINTGAKIDHDCSIGAFVHIAPGSVLCGRVTVGEGTFVGAGSVVIPGKSIGKWSVIGAGSVVISDIPDNVTAVGNPARIIKSNAE